MNIILPITPRTESEEKELKFLKETKRILTEEESARLLFLSIKDLWNCEC